MLRNYIAASMHRAKYEILSDDGSYYGEVPECRGVFANAMSLEECREKLEEVMEEWIFFRLSRSLPIPMIDGIELRIKEVA